MKNILLFPFLLIGFCAAGQNLVPDPGFEIQNTDCNDNFPGLTHWFNPNTATPDLWSMSGCGNNIPSLQAQGVICPEPFEGNAYAGLFTSTTTNTVNHTREYFYCQLTDDLVAGTNYLVSFRAYRDTYYSWSIDKLGIAFTDFAPYFDTFQVIPLEPQLETSGVLIQPDSSYWQLFEFEYTASGGERYLTLGNFRYPTEMMMFNTNSGKGTTRSYHFFDDVSVQTHVSVEEKRSNPESKVWTGRAQLYVHVQEPSTLTLFDISGRKVMTKSVGAGLTEIGMSGQPQGVYIALVNSRGGTKSHKIWKE